MKRSGPTAGSDEFGSFEKNTKGFGMKMLLKMGYKPGTGLGKEGEGIVNPIEAQGRVGTKGLGFGDFLAEKERKQDENQNVSERQTSRWRRRRGTAAPTQTLKSEEESSFRIFDFTGSQPKEVQNINEISILRQPTVLLHSERFPELRHNLQMLISISQREMQESRRTIFNEQRQVSAALEERSRLESEIAKLEHKLQAENKLKSLMLQSLSSASTEDLLLNELLKLISTPSEPAFVEKVHCGIATLISAQMKNQMISLDKVDLVNTWRRLFDINKQYFLDPAIYEHESFYETCARTLLIPPLRSQLIQALTPTDLQLELLAQTAHILGLWYDLIPDQFRHVLIEQHLLPNLSRIIDYWSPVQGTFHLHTPLTPILSIIDRDIDPNARRDLYRNVRIKLAAWLQSLPSSAILDRQNADILLPWISLLPQSELNVLVGRFLLPATEGHLSQLVINPNKQDITPISTILRWQKIIHVSHLAPCIATILPPKIIHTAHAWLTSAAPNYREFEQWYFSWKAIFPENIRNHPKMLLVWYRILKMTEQLLDHPTDPVSLYLPQ